MQTVRAVPLFTGRAVSILRLVSGANRNGRIDRIYRSIAIFCAVLVVVVIAVIIPAVNVVTVNGGADMIESGVGPYAVIGDGEVLVGAGGDEAVNDKVALYGNRLVDVNGTGGRNDNGEAVRNDSGFVYRHVIGEVYGISAVILCHFDQIIEGDPCRSSRYADGKHAEQHYCSK